MMSKNKWAIFLIFAITLAGVMGIPLISPTLSTFREHFNLSDVQSGLLITIYTIPAIVLAPIAGVLADRYGRQVILIPSLLLYGCTGCYIYFLDSFNLILAFRFLQGIGGTSLTLLSRTLIGDFFSGRDRNKIMGLNDGILSLGAMVLPLLGGFLGSIQWSLPFLIYGYAVLLVPGVILIVKHLDSSDYNPAAISYTEQLGKVFGTLTGSLLLSGVLMDFVLLYGAIHTILPLFYAQQFSMSAGSIGLAIGSMSLIVALTSFMNGWITRFMRSETIILLGFACYGAGLTGIGVSTTLVSQIGSLWLFGCGHGLILPTINTSILAIGSKHFRARLMSIRTVMVRLGQAAGPVIFSLLTGYFGYGATLQSVGISIIVLAIIIVIGFLSRKN